MGTSATAASAAISNSLEIKLVWLKARPKGQKMDGWMDGQTDGRTDRQIERYLCLFQIPNRHFFSFVTAFDLKDRVFLPLFLLC